ncbi:2'-phosphotransferase [Malassezia cuniculi]|uniref:2'-phosphotransferase n=1 Tax=Malassezia cuniculi TaxID=948313 RepID=A0AAF0J6R8_9BASI|nr:2'-phosphotransferase [Malassezia cuniculi]
MHHASPLGPIRLAIVVATTLTNGIGARGTLPWRLSRDMAYFRAATMAVGATPEEDAEAERAGRVLNDASRKNAVIMGRNTWESIPPRFRPLGGRINIVVSTKMTYDDLGLQCVDPDTLVVPSFEDAIKVLHARREARYSVGSAAEHTTPLGSAFVIGGAALYRYVLARGQGDGWVLDGLLVTRILRPDVACDTFFDEFRTPAQIAWEAALANKCVGALPEGPNLCPGDIDTESTSRWTAVSPAEHKTYVGGIAHADEAGHVFLDPNLRMSDEIREARELAKQRKQERKAAAKLKAAQPPPPEEHQEQQKAPAEKSEKQRSRNPRADTPDVQLSKALAYILRHGAAKEFLPVRPDGYIKVDLVIARPRVQKIGMDDDGRSPALSDVQRIASADGKKRYELAAGTDESPTDAGDVMWIRAVQGHSISQISELEHTTITPDNIASLLRSESEPPVYYAVHGTNDDAYRAIVASGGLRTMGRNHIHLALDRLGDGVVSGMRKSSTRFLYVDVGKALADGIPFSVSSNGVVLTAGIDQELPLKYVFRTEDAEGHIV